jgi:hypothetical protein
VTGEGFVKRQLYTDGDVAVFAGRRAMILTSIDAGALRGDLADRLVTVELGPLADRRRREDAELDTAFTKAYPRLFGALLDELASMLAYLPAVRPPELPRMADYARILAALDDIHGTQGLATYLDSRSRLAVDVVDSDPVGAAIRRLAKRSGTWSGTEGELLDALTPEHLPKSWPADATRLSGRLRRLAPALRTVGIDVDTHRANGHRVIRLSGTASDPAAALSDPAAALFDDGKGAGQRPRSAASAAEDAPDPYSLCCHQQEKREGEKVGETASSASTASKTTPDDDLRAALHDELEWQPISDDELLDDDPRPALERFYNPLPRGTP